MRTQRHGNVLAAEPLVLLVLVAATAFAILIAVDKMAFLSFYQLPVLIAAYFLGRRQGVMIAVAAVLMVGIYAAMNPSVFEPPPGRGPGVALFIWGAFTVVTAYVVGTLYEAKAAVSTELRTAYAGLVDVLSELVDAVDQYAESHSARVAKMAARIGVAMNLPVDEIEDVRVAGLLHDLHKTGVANAVLRKASAANGDGGETASGVAVARRVGGDTGGLLKNVVPLIEMCAERFDGSGPAGLGGVAIPRGTRILCVADAWDQLVAHRPHGRGLTPPEALMEIERDSGLRFDPTVVDALILAAESQDPS